MSNTHTTQKTPKRVTNHARAAKMIRADLKTHFPETKFSVRSQSYSGGSSIDVKWTDGPTSEAVGSIVKEYQYGHFDGMTDSYEKHYDEPEVTRDELSGQAASAPHRTALHRKR